MLVMEHSTFCVSLPKSARLPAKAEGSGELQGSPLTLGVIVVDPYKDLGPSSVWDRHNLRDAVVEDVGQADVKAPPLALPPNADSYSQLVNQEVVGVGEANLQIAGRHDLGLVCLE